MKHGLTHSRTVAFALILVLLGTVPAIAQNTFPTSGNVGIGTTSPSGLLHIHGTGRTELFLDAPLQNNLVLTFQADGANRFSLYREAVTGDFAIDSNQAANLFRMTSLGNVGIGTTTPLAQLHVAGSGRTSIFVDAPLANAATMTFLSGGQTRYSVYRPAGTSDLVLESNAMSNVLYLTNDGRVGMGTTNPSAKLHVTGSVQVDGNIAAKYQDVAEWVRTSRAVSEGTVVVIDSLERDRVLPSSAAYDTRVAGVISASPGVLLGTEGEGKAKVAHSGRVKVKVDSTYGAITVGDLLVTSPTPGYAMRSTPVQVGGVSIHRPGTLVGKALEPLDNGRGEILILLMLQ